MKKSETHIAVGKPLQRIDAIDKVTGSARYAADLKLDNMLHGECRIRRLQCDLSCNRSEVDRVEHNARGNSSEFEGKVNRFQVSGVSLSAGLKSDQTNLKRNFVLS